MRIIYCDKCNWVRRIKDDALFCDKCGNCNLHGIGYIDLTQQEFEQILDGQQVKCNHNDSWITKSPEQIYKIINNLQNKVINER